MVKNLKDLLIEELHDILSAEEQIVEALPKLVQAAESPDLKKAFEGHLKETKGQVQRLTKIFKLLKVQKEEKLCKAAKGLIQECSEVLKDIKTKSPVRDAALISKAQRIEHYEISAYGTVRTYATELGLDDVADLLQDTLDEEGNADKKLTGIAEGGLLRSGVNQKAIAQSGNNDKAVKKSPSTPKKATRATTHKTEVAPKTKSKPVTALKTKRKPALAKK